MAEMTKKPQQSEATRSERKHQQQKNENSKESRKVQPSDAKNSVQKAGDEVTNQATRVFTRGSYIRSRFEALEAGVRANGEQMNAVFKAVTEIKGYLAGLLKDDQETAAGDDHMEEAEGNEVGNLSWARVMSEDADMNAKLLADFQESEAGSPDDEETLEPEAQFEVNTANIISKIRRELKEDAERFESGTDEVRVALDK